MFFLNQSLKYILLDFPSIKDPDSCLNSLEKVASTFEHLFILDWRGKERVIRFLDGKNLPNLKKKISVFPESEDEFGWLVFPIDDFFNINSVSPLDCLFISENEDHLNTVQFKPLGTVAFAKSLGLTLAKLGTDSIIDSWDELPQILKGELIGYWGEAELSPKNSFIKVSIKAIPRASLAHIPNDKLPAVPIYYGGRYLSTADEASRRHLYTQRLLNAKNQPSIQGPHFTSTVKTIVDYIISREKISGQPLITYVPKKPSDPIDRMGVFLEHFSNNCQRVDPVLKCIKDYPKQSGVGAHALRAANVKDAFLPVNIEKIINSEIILVDDIGTSFSTVNECAKVLLKAGARKVVIICLSLTCDPSPIVLAPLICPKCHKTMVIRFKTKGSHPGTPFWGCRGFPTCKNAVEFNAGLKNMRTLDRAPSSDEVSF